MSYSTFAYTSIFTVHIPKRKHSQHLRFVSLLSETLYWTKLLAQMCPLFPALTFELSNASQAAGFVTGPVHVAEMLAAQLTCNINKQLVYIV